MPPDVSGQAGRLLPLAIAARALNLHPDVVRKKALAGKLDARKDNHGRWLVRVDGPDHDPDASGSDDPGETPGPIRTHPTRMHPGLEARAAAAEAEAKELRARIDDVRAHLGDARAERDLAREMVAAERAVLKAERVERCAERAAHAEALAASETRRTELAAEVECVKAERADAAARHKAELEAEQGRRAVESIELRARYGDALAEAQRPWWRRLTRRRRMV